jgi:hypothetical protein
VVTQERRGEMASWCARVPLTSEGVWWRWERRGEMDSSVCKISFYLKKVCGEAGEKG